jgi:hypothetical protein
VGVSAKAKTTPDVPVATEMMPDCTMPLPTAPAAWSPPPPTTGVPSFSRSLRSALEMRPETSNDSYTRGSISSSICSASSTLVLQRRSGTFSSEVPEASETSVANSPVSLKRT